MPQLNFVDLASFERGFAPDLDPWRFKATDDEREKSAATLDALPPGCYASGLEIGCGTGVLTRQLAATCDTLLAVDIATRAIQRAERFCDDLPWVQFAVMDVRRDWPEGHFDLILFSGGLACLGHDGIAAAASRSLASLSPSGAVLLVSWLGPTEIDRSGEEAAEHFVAAARPRLVPTLQRRTQHYRIDALANTARRNVIT